MQKIVKVIVALVLVSVFGVVAVTAYDKSNALDYSRALTRERGNDLFAAKAELVTAEGTITELSEERDLLKSRLKTAEDDLDRVRYAAEKTAEGLSKMKAHLRAILDE